MTPRQSKIATNLLGRFVTRLEELRHCWRLEDDLAEVVALDQDPDGELRATLAGATSGKIAQVYVTAVRLLSPQELATWPVAAVDAKAGRCAIRESGQ